ncbi:MAG: DsbA family protein [Gemmatimonadales bacterium]
MSRSFGIRHLCPLVALAGIGLGACSPSPEQLRAAVVQHPEIVLAAIEAHPEAFISALRKAAAKTTAAAESPEAERRRLDSAFAHPHVPVITRRAVLGNPSAPITIVEYSDFQCPYCRAEREVLVQLMREYGDTLRLVVKQTPLQMHPMAMPAALMYEAVARQSPMAAYRFYDDVFEHQERLTSEGATYLTAAARAAGAGPARAAADAKSPAIRAVVDADLDEGRRFGFTGTPGFLINGVALMGAHPIGDFEEIINRQLAQASQR